jgi:protein TonB
MNFRISNLKRAYQRNMLIGFITAGLLFVSVFALAATWTDEYEQVVIAADDNMKPDTLIVRPPIPPGPTDIINIKTGSPPEPPEIGEIVPVAESLVEQTAEIPTQDQLAKWVPDNPEFDPDRYTSDANIKKVIETLLPQPDEFIPREVDPVQLNTANPVYPPIAQRAGMEGVVWINALVGEEGKVLDVIMVKESNPKADFGAAAIEAAYKTTWKPALANGQPVAVWVTYKVEFILR